MTAEHHMLSDCEEMEARLSPFADGELFGDERAAVERHLATCSGCRQSLEDYRTIGVTLREHVAAESVVRPAAVTWPPKRSARPAPARALTAPRRLAYNVARRLDPWPVFAGAAALAVLVIGLGLFRPSGLPVNVVEIDRLDAAGPVMVLPGKGGGMTIIWLFEVEEGSPTGVAEI